MKSYGARSTVLLVLAFIFIQHVVANSVQDDVALLRDALPADIAKRRAALIRKVCNVIAALQLGSIFR